MACTSRAKPKSAIFSTLSSMTRTFLAARSRWIHYRKNREEKTEKLMQFFSLFLNRNQAIIKEEKITTIQKKKKERKKHTREICLFNWQILILSQLWYRWLIWFCFFSSLICSEQSIAKCIATPMKERGWDVRRLQPLRQYQRLIIKFFKIMKSYFY